MTHNAANSFGQPSLNDLMVRFLATRSDAAPVVAVESAEGGVEPYDVAAGFWVDPRAAWTDAVASLELAGGSPPPEWAAVAGQPAGSYAVPMAAGNFPQRVKDLQPLLTRFNPAGLRPTGDRPATSGLTALRGWVAREGKKADAVAVLLAAGVARGLCDFDRAAELLASAEPLCTGGLRAAWENERAALLWQTGECDAALAAWTAAIDTPAAQFNRGMALLFLGRLADAKVALAEAARVLPEAGGWNALARLYLAVAEIHG